MGVEEGSDAADGDDAGRVFVGDGFGHDACVLAAGGDAFGDGDFEVDGFAFVGGEVELGCAREGYPTGDLGVIIFLVEDVLGIVFIYGEGGGVDADAIVEGAGIGDGYVACGGFVRVEF